MNFAFFVMNSNLGSLISHIYKQAAMNNSV